MAAGTHFQKYPLITKKRGDFELFSSAIELMCNKEHLTKEGLDKLVAIRASMNLGLSELLKASFPLCKPVQQFSDRDLAPLNSKFNPQWVVGFTCGEGYFGVKLLSSFTIKTVWGPPPAKAGGYPNHSPPLFFFVLFTC